MRTSGTPNCSAASLITDFAARGLGGGDGRLIADRSSEHRIEITRQGRKILHIFFGDDFRALQRQDGNGFSVTRVSSSRDRSMDLKQFRDAHRDVKTALKGFNTRRATRRRSCLLLGTSHQENIFQFPTATSVRISSIQRVTYLFMSFPLSSER